MNYFLRAIVLIFVVTAVATGADSTKNLVFDAKGVAGLDIDCGAGFLKVTGDEGINEIKVKAEIDVEGLSEEDLREFIDKHVRLSLEQKGSRVVLTSKSEGQGWFSGRNARINMTVAVPKKIDVEINDGSGFVEVKEITGYLFIEDGSGSIDIKNIHGDVDIEDGSGEINVDNIAGNVKIEDGSGSIRITNIDGSVRIKDGSGSINIDGVRQDVTIDESGNGGLSIKNVDGHVKTDE